MNTFPKEIISYGKDQDWSLEKFKSHSRKSEIEVGWTGKASKKIIFVDPILNNEDNYKNDWDIWSDVWKEGDHENIDNVVAIPISKVKLRIL